MNLGSMQFGTADKNVDQPLRERKAGFPHVLEQISHETLII
jgi:hypothetical protein